MLLWMTPSEAPKAFQASECSKLFDPMRASCVLCSCLAGVPCIFGMCAVHYFSLCSVQSFWDVFCAVV